MAIIDLRHLIEPEFDTIIITGDQDGKDYRLPVKKTIKASLQAQYDINKLNDNKENMSEIDYNLEAGYIYITAWIRSYYPELSLQWVKDNITNEMILSELISRVTNMYFPKLAETVTPKRSQKTKTRRKS